MKITHIDSIKKPSRLVISTIITLTLKLKETSQPHGGPPIQNQKLNGNGYRTYRHLQLQWVSQVLARMHQSQFYQVPPTSPSKKNVQLNQKEIPMQHSGENLIPEMRRRGGLTASHSRNEAASCKLMQTHSSRILLRTHTSVWKNARLRPHFEAGRFMPFMADLALALAFVFLTALTFGTLGSFDLVAVVFRLLPFIPSPLLSRQDSRTKSSWSGGSCSASASKAMRPETSTLMDVKSQMMYLGHTSKKDTHKTHKFKSRLFRTNTIKNKIQIGVK